MGLGIPPWATLLIVAPKSKLDLSGAFGVLDTCTKGWACRLQGKDSPPRTPKKHASGKAAAVLARGQLHADGDPSAWA